MSTRALEFVETWVSEKIEEEGYPEEGREEAVANEWAAECREAALEDGIPGSEINEAFDDLGQFITGEMAEAREREEDEDEDDEDEDEYEDDDVDEEESEDDDEEDE
jgi:hypothetical protein